MIQQLVPQSLTANTANAAGDFPAESLSAHCAHLRAFCVSKRRQIAELRSQIAEQTQRLIQFDGDDVLEDLQQAVNHARLERDQQAEEAARHQNEAAELAQTVSDLRRQIESLKRNPSGASEGAGLSDEEREELEDLRRRYEMSLEDVKAERARCRELEDKLLRGSNATLTGIGGGSDWESQKRRLMAALEDFDASEEEQAEKLRIEEVIRRTDAIVANKDREIAGLQRMLEEQNANVGAVAAGASAVAELLDKDEIVQRERKNLEALQTEWREKLRTAEVEISMQRAKLARQQAQLEEKTQEIEAHLRRSVPLGEVPAGRKEKSGRGRWLRRLGLKGGDEEN